MSNNYITRCHRRLRWVPVGVGVSWGQDASVRISLRTEGLLPSVTHGWATPAKMRKKCCYGQKNFGSICSSLSPSPTHLSLTTNINPFENKVWEIYFYKEVCSFVHWSSSLLLTMFPDIFVYVCGYTTAVLEQYFYSKFLLQVTFSFSSDSRKASRTSVLKMWEQSRGSREASQKNPSSNAGKSSRERWENALDSKGIILKEKPCSLSFGIKINCLWHQPVTFKAHLVFYINIYYTKAF